MKLVFEQYVEPDEVKSEDSGQAKIVEIADDHHGVFVRLQSWAEDRHHTLFNHFVGTRVRVTVETF